MKKKRERERERSKKCKCKIRKKNTLELSFSPLIIRQLLGKRKNDKWPAIYAGYARRGSMRWWCIYPPRSTISTEGGITSQRRIGSVSPVSNKRDFVSSHPAWPSLASMRATPWSIGPRKQNCENVKKKLFLERV
jgi:hypothetical protein